MAYETKDVEPHFDEYDSDSQHEQSNDIIHGDTVLTWCFATTVYYREFPRNHGYVLRCFALRVQSMGMCAN